MGVTAVYPEKIANLDLIAVISRLDRIYVEMCKCQSANWPSGLFDADKARFVDYLDDFESELNYVTSRPIPDSPEAGGMLLWDVPKWDEMFLDPESIENDDVAQVLRQLIVYRVECANAQSARLIMGFIPVAGGPSDVVRMKDGLQRLRNMVTFVAATQPSDRPESTPREMSVDAGRVLEPDKKYHKAHGTTSPLNINIFQNTTISIKPNNHIDE